MEDDIIADLNANKSYLQNEHSVDYRTNLEIKKLLENETTDETKECNPLEKESKTKESFIKIMNRPILLKPKLISEMKNNAKVDNMPDINMRRPSRQIKELKDYILNNESVTEKNNLDESLNKYKKLEIARDSFRERDHHDKLIKINTPK